MRACVRACVRARAHVEYVSLLSAAVVTNPWRRFEGSPHYGIIIINELVVKRKIFTMAFKLITAVGLDSLLSLAYWMEQ